MDFWIEGAKSVLSRMWEKKNEEKKNFKIVFGTKRCSTERWRNSDKNFVSVFSRANPRLISIWLIKFRWWSCQYFPEQIQG